jgi:hypothetical protein
MNFPPTSLSRETGLPHGPSERWSPTRVPAVFAPHLSSLRLHLLTCFAASWLHFLCKSVKTQPIRTAGRELRQIVSQHNRWPPEPLPQSDYAWLRSGYLLRYSAPSLLRRTGSSDSGQTLQPTKDVTLFCFGSPPALVDKCRRLLTEPLASKASTDPFFLLEIVLGELFAQLDNNAWQLAGAFSDLEHVRVPFHSHGFQWYMPEITRTIHLATVLTYERKSLGTHCIPVG